jgi:hypothetical protein
MDLEGAVILAVLDGVSKATINAKSLRAGVEGYSKEFCGANRRRVCKPFVTPILLRARRRQIQSFRESTDGLRPVEESRYSGILSCFFQGFSSFLFRSIASTLDNRLRVACGIMTSSI